MGRLYHLIILIYVTFIICFFIQFVESNDQSMVHRQRRYLSFRNVSHIFIRLNFKVNMVPWNQIFVQALGFRMNWDDPPDSFHPYHRLNRRDVFMSMETLLNRNGLEGFHCVRRAICEVNQMDETNAIYFKILKMIFRENSSETAKWHGHAQEDCQISISSCPFSLLEVSPYTDL
ncbi:uncharacterized protein LOC123659173 [Melitaea cinxia]|uniref:uncharacterized protein LOC123659173 n=1 Tax=Melitaea cinxia TaxID=113334 RepID=UPI001E27132D|nr:uncharacterized protein LOC123659173 [Melitaea cinxia]